MQRKKLGIAAIILVTIALTSIANAATFYFVFNETPFDPNNYHWQEPWEIKEMVDFLEATLTITGCGYQGQLHNVELAIENVATVANYYAVSFAYTANWWIDSENQEVIIQGLYSGGLGVGETMIDTTTFQPSLIGAGLVKMDIIDIVWAQPEPITWATNIVDTAGVVGSSIGITAFGVTGASMNIVEPGLVSVSIKSLVSGTFHISFNVEIVELAQTVGAEVAATLNAGQTISFAYPFDALENGGAYTMRLTITGWNA